MRRQIVLALALGALTVPLAFVGGQWLRDARQASPTTEQAGGALAAPIPTPSPDPLIASVTRDEAIALVRSLAEDLVRVDRIEAKLVPWTELAPIGMGVDLSGGPGHGGSPNSVVWAVAVSGDVYVSHRRPHDAPRQHFPWALWGVDAYPFARIVSLNVGPTGNWPPGFDALADHVAVAPTPPPPAPAPPAFDLIFSAPAAPPELREVVAADEDAVRLYAIGHLEPRKTGTTVPFQLLHSADGGRTWRALHPPTTGSGPRHVAASGDTVLVSDLGSDTANYGVSTSGGLYLSRDGGSTWSKVRMESIGQLLVYRDGGRVLFLAEQFWVSGGAASGPSGILASDDGEDWRRIGEAPGPANFAAADVPLVFFEKNVPGDGIYRIEGADLPSLRLVAIPGSVQPGSLHVDPITGDLWGFRRNGVPGIRHSSDGGKTWPVADVGLEGQTEGLFFSKGATYAIGSSALYWDGSRWRVAKIVTGKAARVFQLGSTVLIQDITGAIWRSR